MSQNVNSYRGEKDGVKGTWYVEQVRGGPGGYPYERKHFVPDNSPLARRDTRHVDKNYRPWE